MGLPCINNPIEFKGYKFYRDSLDKNLVYFSPISSDWDVRNRQEFGDLAVEWYFKTDLISETILEDFQKEFKFKTAPIPFKSWNINLKLTIIVNPPHQSNLSHIYTTPFPTLSVSFSLLKNDSNFELLDETIRKAADNNSILAGVVEGACDCLKVGFFADLKLNLKFYSQILEGSLGDSSTKRDYINSIFSIISSEYNNIVAVKDGVITNEDKIKINSIIFDLIYAKLVSKELVEKDFDQGLEINKIILRKPMEFGSSPEIVPISRSEIIIGHGISTVF